MSIRRLTRGDQALLWEMLYLAIFVPEGLDPPTHEVVRQPALSIYVEDWGAPHDLGLAAIDQASGEALGAAWLRLLRGEQRGYGYVDELTPEVSVAVRPGHRGAGIGTRLLARLLREAEGLHPAVSLSVSEANPATRLYLRLGFKPVARDGDSIIMVRRTRPLHGGRSAGERLWER